MSFAHLIRDIADFPKPGIVFKDITPMLADPDGFAWAIRRMAEPWRAAGIAAVAGVEARGFILAAAVAVELRAGFVPLRKPGKLPGERLGEDYALEYGHDRLEVHVDAVARGQRVLLVDDVLATGGTLAAAARLLGRAGAELAGAGVFIELNALGGRARWPGASPLLAALNF